MLLTLLVAFENALVPSYSFFVFKRLPHLSAMWVVYTLWPPAISTSILGINKDELMSVDFSLVHELY